MIRLILLAGVMLFAAPAFAKEVRIEKVVLDQVGPWWTAHVTLKHDDQDMKHYANAWRIVDDKKNVLVQQELYHPHTGEKTFTLHKADIRFPDKLRFVYVEAAAKPHGWSKKRVRIDLNGNKGDKYEIRRAGKPK